MISWVEECHSIVDFVVLISGSTSYVFNASLGLHKGCQLPPLLFLLVVDSSIEFYLRKRR